MHLHENAHQIRRTEIPTSYPTEHKEQRTHIWSFNSGDTSKGNCPTELIKRVSLVWIVLVFGNDRV